MACIVMIRVGPSNLVVGTSRMKNEWEEYMVHDVVLERCAVLAVETVHKVGSVGEVVMRYPTMNDIQQHYRDTQSVKDLHLCVCCTAGERLKAGIIMTLYGLV